MWRYIRKKLGIKDYEDELIKISSKLYLTLRLVNECVELLGKMETQSKEVSDKINEIEAKIKAIPKEIVIKNVLSI